MSGSLHVHAEALLVSLIRMERLQAVIALDWNPWNRPPADRSAPTGTSHRRQVLNISKQGYKPKDVNCFDGVVLVHMLLAPVTGRTPRAALGELRRALLGLARAG